MTLRVTFDTNSLDKACRPERFPKDSHQSLFQTVNAALKSKRIDGFYSVTLLTLEAIQRKDRAAVHASTRVQRQPEQISVTKNADLPSTVREIVGDQDVLTVRQEMRVEQSTRPPLPDEFVRRIQTAKALGLRVLKAPPRIGAFRIDDPAGEYYLSPEQEGRTLGQWIDKVHKVCCEIGARGVGYAQVRALGEKLRLAGDPDETWFRGLAMTNDIHERREVERAFKEWADGDSVASHVAYGLDIFCTGDQGRSNAGASVLDAANRAWLNQTYDVRFMTIEELAGAY